MTQAPGPCTDITYRTSLTALPNCLTTRCRLPPKLARAMLDILPVEVWSEPEYEVARSILQVRCLPSRDRHPSPGGTSRVGAELHEASGSHLQDNALRHLDHRDDWAYFPPEYLLLAPRQQPSRRRQVQFQTRGTCRSSVPHTRFVDGRCTECGAPEELERGDRHENLRVLIYPWPIPTKELSHMKFDVIVGNPPYQVDSDGNTRTMPVYHRFVRRAIEMAPRYVLMITPSRWFSGGWGSTTTEHRC